MSFHEVRLRAAEGNLKKNKKATRPIHRVATNNNNNKIITKRPRPVLLLLLLLLFLRSLLNGNWNTSPVVLSARRITFAVNSFNDAVNPLICDLRAGL